MSRGLGWSQLKRDAAGRAPEAPMRTLHSRAPQARRSQGPGLLERMFGRSAAPRPAAAHPSLAPRPAAAPRPAMARPRLVMTQPGGAEVQGPRRRGAIRILLSVFGLAWALLAFRPWTHVGSLAEGLRQGRAKAEAHSPAKPRRALDPVQALLQPTPSVEPSPEPSPQGTPVMALKGRPVALAALAGGRWLAVDREGYAQPCSGPEDPELLGLPFLKGAQPRPQAERGRWVLRCVEGEALAGVFPLHSALATEVESVSFDPEGALLRLTDGAEARLGLGDTRAKQAWLAAVLADLAAKGKRAGSIDLRFKGQAVVRLAAR